MHTHALAWGVVVTFFAVCFLCYAGFVGVLAVIEDWTQDLPDIHNEEAFAYSEKTRIYANDHTTLLAEFYLQDQEPVEKDDISPYVWNGTVATEDVRFFEHDGVDLLGIARALVNNLVGGELEGASTITQQLVRNTLLSSEASDISLKRKVREAELALALENEYSKDEILLMYLNTINYGSGCYGIEAAAQHYFSVSAGELSIAQAATLIGIPQSPTYNNPELYPENCVKRRNVVLSRMFNNGIISQEEYDAARSEELILNIKTKGDQGIYLYPYFTSYVRQLLLDQLSFEEVFSGGLTVYTTIDPTLQGYAEDAARTVYAEMAESGDSDVELSLTCVDPDTGFVLAMIGGNNWEESQFNLATSASGRQAGSAFKTFTVAAAIEAGISPMTAIDCSTGYVHSAWETPVTNYNNANYGYLTLEQMTWKSANTGFARLVTDEDGVSPASVLEMAERLGVSGDEEYGYGAYPALTLGAAQTNTLRMASAYATFATGGIYYEDICIEQVLDNDGETLIDNTSPTGKRVLSAEVSGAVTDILRGVVTYGTGKAAALASGQVSAGKTGTSQDHRDLWYCGYTPQLSCAVWAGADPEREMWEASWCKDAWRIFMERALGGTALEDFASTDEPTYDSPFTEKQAQYAKDASTSMLEDLEESSLDEIKRALGSELTIIEEYSDTIAAGEVILLTYADEGYVAYVSRGEAPDPTDSETQESNNSNTSSGTSSNASSNTSSNTTGSLG